MSGKSAIKLAVILAGILLLVSGGYFLRCATRNPLFFYNFEFELDPGESSYRYFLGDRLEFCWNFLSQPRSPRGTDNSVAIPTMGVRDKFRITPNTPHPPYNSNPPTSGWNYASTEKFERWKGPRRLTFAESVEPEVMVNKLYSGYVWITFSTGSMSEKEILWLKKIGISDRRIQGRVDRTQKRQRPSDDIITALKSIASDTPLVIITGWPISKKDITLNALGRQDAFDLEGGRLTQEHIDRIWDFILRYRNQPQTPKSQLELMDDQPEQQLTPADE